jgi:hypothetical protein
MSSINYSEAIQSKKRYLYQIKNPGRNIIGERDDSIIVERAYYITIFR